MARKIALASLVILLVDISLASAAKHFLALWDVGKIERKYRIRSTVYHHDLAPSVEAIGVWGTRQYRVRTNSLGFKDKAIRQVPVKSPGRRILFIGDSFTEGIGLGFERTFVGIIGDELSNQGIDVLNAGGYLRTHHRYTLES